MEGHARSRPPREDPETKSGKLLKDRMEKERVDEDDILEAARQSHGLERLEQIRSAVLERQGSISIIPAHSGGR